MEKEKKNQFMVDARGDVLIGSDHNADTSSPRAKLYIRNIQYEVDLENNGSETAMVSMSSSQGKVSRKWNSMMKSISLDGKNGPYTPPSFSHVYMLSSVLNTGKGNQWYGYNVKKIGMLEDVNMYERAKKFYEGIKNKA